MEVPAMDSEAELLFTEAEWAAAMPGLVRDMTAPIVPVRFGGLSRAPKHWPRQSL
jgi:hypothetical protein